MVSSGASLISGFHSGGGATSPRSNQFTLPPINRVTFTQSPTTLSLSTGDTNGAIQISSNLSGAWKN
jgi:hypothetical protein